MYLFFGMFQLPPQFPDQVIFELRVRLEDLALVFQCETQLSSLVDFLTQQNVFITKRQELDAAALSCFRKT